MFRWFLKLFKALLDFKLLTLIYIWYLFGGLLEWILIILLDCLPLSVLNLSWLELLASNHGTLFTDCIASLFLFSVFELSWFCCSYAGVALCYVCLLVLFTAFLSFLICFVHNCLTLSFWVFVPSIFVMTLHSLTVPIIATIGPLFYVTI